MFYFDNPTQVVYKYFGELAVFRGIAIADQIIDLLTGELVDIAEVLLIETYDSWDVSFFIEE